MNKPQQYLKWERVKQGASLHHYELIVVEEVLSREVRKPKSSDLRRVAEKISKCLSEETNKKYWNVLLVKGEFGKKFVCSGNFFVLYEREDGMKAFVWLNRLEDNKDSELSIIQKSIYF